jgi:hypothetical protein
VTTLRPLRPRRELARLLAFLPAGDAPPWQVVLFALGAGTLASVAVSSAEQLLRLLAQRPPQLAGEPLAAAVGLALAVASRGLDRTAIWVVAVRALLVAGTFVALALTYALVQDSRLRDPLAPAGPAFVALLVGAAAGLAIGILARSALPPAPRASEPHLLVRAVGVAIVATATVHFLWPAALVVAASGATRADDLRAVLPQLPEMLAGPIAGGVYAARRGAGYVEVLVLGAILALPIALAIVGGASDRSVLGGQALRGSLGVGLFLVGLRVVAWPLAAAFVHGFLTPPQDSRTVSEDHI